MVEEKRGRERIQLLDGIKESKLNVKIKGMNKIEMNREGLACFKGSTSFGRTLKFTFRKKGWTLWHFFDTLLTKKKKIEQNFNRDKES